MRLLESTGRNNAARFAVGCSCCNVLSAHNLTTKSGAWNDQTRTWTALTNMLPVAYDLGSVVSPAD